MTDLAILGGEKAVPDGAIKHWPPVDDTDREMVMASLNGGDHACGPSPLVPLAMRMAGYCRTPEHRSSG